ncbi:MAG: protease modulator HflC [Alphaproteobacteria bacterium]
MSKSFSFLGFLLVAGFLIVSQSAFIVTQGQQAMVLQFGKPVSMKEEPGLYFKTPFIQNARFFSQKVLSVDPLPEEVILADQKRIVVDTFGRYKITDMLKFNNNLVSEDMARERLANIMNSMTREVLGTATLADVLSEKRAPLMNAIRDKVNEGVKGNLGVEIVDVRIGRAELPEQTSQAIYARMRTAREKEAADFRGQGKETAQDIKSKAEKERTVTLATAEKDAQILRGQGDEAAIKIYADAFERDPEFYAFYRSMEAYRATLGDENTTMILSPDNDFFRFFKSGQSAKK